MGIWAWFRQWFAAPAARGKAKRARRPKAATCPNCNQPLRTEHAKQCLACGANWHRLEDSVGGSRRLQEGSRQRQSQPASKTPAAAHLAGESWTEEGPPPQSLREALDLGPLAPPRKKRKRSPLTSEARDLASTAVAEEEATTARPAPMSDDASIGFLGRGVSRSLAEQTSNVARLVSLGLPTLETPEELAEQFGLTTRRLRWLAWHAAATTRPHYVAFEVPKRSGGVRQLASPHVEMARCQEWILRNILDAVAVSEGAHGFVRGRSIVTNAAAHVGQDVVVNLDLKDFFPSLTFVRVRGIYAGLGYAPAVATVLALLCTECPRQTLAWRGTTWHVATAARSLPQGACTSPALSNLACRRFDKRLAALAAKLGWKYTRYADDLSFSASGEATRHIAYVMDRVRRIALEEDFAINESKTRVLRQNTAQLVTGVVVNERPGVPRTVVRRVLALLPGARKTGLAAQNREARLNFESWLEGTIAFISMVNPQQGEPLRAALAKVRAIESAEQA